MAPPPSSLDTTKISAPATGRHYILGLGIFVGLVLLFYMTHRILMHYDPRIAAALQGGAMPALATFLGTLPVLFAQQFSQRTFDGLLGFGAGVMLAASVFSLIMPALEASGVQGFSAWGAGLITGGGILLGAALLLAMDKLVPHEHFVKGVEGMHAHRLKRAWLFVWAIVLHNFPEGLAIGVAYAGTDNVGATALTTGISIQDVPEGLVVAATLRGVGYGRTTAVGIGAASGLVEPLAAVMGAAVIGISNMFLPWGLAFAAGAMLYIISHEIIPESHRAGHETLATGGLMIGFVLMMLLDTALG
ncbi:ZIP family metal transporter [Noviherbaspirillum sp. CPCC 100848]|uniref:ZIP family metal transporter n=1 Tax=Noviherbaspirillum album TaxID=3080276 RepID=A0ABU6J257_9BURK|nr:ZIP family metal transporter [Noviherbaspirillum sp. CPCC 100848]MEC4717713.1 ZIP family metal transporter [Noviherbaspirillum sp. CPCC 100848]